MIDNIQKKKSFSLKFTTKELTIIPIFTALTAVLSQIVIPLPFTPIAINLATLSVYLAGGLLGAKNGTISQLVYVILGAVGIPVFTGLSGGLGIVTGPTGGYIAGYVLAAFTIGIIIHFMGKSVKVIVFALVIGTLLLYTLGTMWFMTISNTQLIPALTMCVIPFLPGDGLKIALATFLISRLKNYVN